MLCAFIRLRRDDDDSEERMNMIVDCHFHIDETMLTLEKMIEGMDQNQVAKTALIAPMNETMFEKDSTIQHRIQNLFRSRILHVPPIGFPIYDGLVRDGLFNLETRGRFFRFIFFYDETREPSEAAEKVILKRRLC